MAAAQHNIADAWLAALEAYLDGKLQSRLIYRVVLIPHSTISQYAELTE